MIKLKAFLIYAIGMITFYAVICFFIGYGLYHGVRWLTMGG